MSAATATMSPQGRVVIPIATRREMGVEGPAELLFRCEDGRIIIETIEAAVVYVRAIVARHVLEGRSLVDELIAERRAEAAAEWPTSSTRRRSWDWRWVSREGRT